MTTSTAPSTPPHGDDLLAIYDDALREVHGYLHRRLRNRSVAEDVTTEVFMAAVQSIRREQVETVTIAWLIGIARHKLVDHWRRVEREQRRTDAVTNEPSNIDEPWTAHLDQLAIADVMADLSAAHRGVLTLRYVDDLPVPEVALIIDRTVHATEALLVRARRSFRTRYEEVMQ